MSEVATPPVQEQPAGQAAAVAEVQDQSVATEQQLALSNMESQIEILRENGLDKTPDFIEIEKQYQALLAKSIPAVAAPAAAAPAAPAAAAAQPGQAAPAAAAPAATPLPGSEAALASVFFGTITPSDGKALEFKSLDDFGAHMAKELGIEVKADDKNFIPTLIDNAKQWKEGAAAKVEVETRLQAIESDISQLPEPLFNAIQAWGNGQDWKAAVATANTAIDLSVDVSTIDKSVLLNHYFPGGYTAEVIKEGGPLVDSGYDLAKKQFARDKESFTTERNAILAASKESQNKVTQSVQTAVTSLKTEFPSLADTEVQKIKNLLEKGGVMSLFVDEKGVYRPEAAKRLALVLNGEQEIKNLVEAVRKRTEIAQGIVSTGKENLEPGAQQQFQPKNELDMAAEVESYRVKSVYDSRPSKT